MRLFSSAAATHHQGTEHANAIIAKNDIMEQGGNIIENTHILRRDLGAKTSSGHQFNTKMFRNSSSASSTTSGSHKKHKTNNFEATNTGRGSRERQPRERQQDNEEYKSRSLERYAKPPHTLAAQACGALDPHEDDGDDEDEIYAAARRTLTPSLSTQRRRLLSPFVSMKRRSRSSISSSGSRSHCDSREVNFQLMLPPLKLPGPMQQHIMEQQKSNSNLNCLKTSSKHLGNSASSQSGDSGTGGTELEQDCSRTSAAESSQLSLSYSQLSSASSTHSLSKQSKMSHSNTHSRSNVSSLHIDQHLDEENDHEDNAEYKNKDNHLRNGNNGHDNEDYNEDVDIELNKQHVVENYQHVASTNHQHLNTLYTNKENLNCNESEQVLEKEREEKNPLNNRLLIDQPNYRDSVFSSDDFYCGNITLVDDTYSNYDPENDAERMFLQVVGILRDEKEVGI